MKSFLLYACWLLFIPVSVVAQSTDAWLPVFEKINQEVQQNSQAYQRLKEATSTIGHRLTGSSNGKKAEDYVARVLRSWGCKDVRFQPFAVESWSRGSLSLSVGTDGKMQAMKAVTLAHSPVKAEVNLPMADMGNGLEEDYLNNPEKVRGKIALVYLGVLPNSKPGTGTLHRSEKTALAIKYGAKGIIIINTPPGGILLTGTASVTGKLISIPAICIGREDGIALKERLAQSPLNANIKMTNQSAVIKARNVIATFQGSSLPREKIVVGGHLDSWDLATGAIDNGIGSFSVLDMARTFQVLGLKTARTIEFVLFMGEEQGLLGSRHYVANGNKNKELEQIRYMLNYDMTNDPKGFSSSTDTTKELFQQIGATVQKVDPAFPNMFRSGAGLHSDHQPFLLQGIPTGGGAGGSLPNNAGPCYHADCDDFKLVDEQGMKNTVRYNTMLVYALANVSKIPAKKLSDEETRLFLIKNKLQEPLRISGDWRWKDKKD
ncbi:MAG: M28 family peptidase [Chitinophagaceae bacterium]|nr:M28 family peptidase [Chitinophagaceae bacterium]MCA6511232.1 M28 family peptidase [Chitinophagaceae bacterium]